MQSGSLLCFKRFSSGGFVLNYSCRCFFFFFSLFSLFFSPVKFQPSACNNYSSVLFLRSPDLLQLEICRVKIKHRVDVRRWGQSATHLTHMGVGWRPWDGESKMKRERKQPGETWPKSSGVYFLRRSACTHHLCVGVCWHELIAEECGGKQRNRKSPSEQWARSSHTHTHNSLMYYLLLTGLTLTCR